MSAEGKDVAVDVRGVDPWGLRRVEQLLRTVEGVDSLKIVPDGKGGIDEIHVLSSSGLGAKQIVRNIESALLAQFGLQVDHRKISIAQVRERDLPRDEIEVEPAPEATRGRRFLLDSFHLERKTGELVVCGIRLRNGDQVLEGEAEGPDYAKSRLDVTARAVLSAVAQSVEGVSFAVEGIEEVELFGRRLIVAVIHCLAGRNLIALPGISKIHDSQEEAVVLACLNATNRWVDKL